MTNKPTQKYFICNQCVEEIHPQAYICHSAMCKNHYTPIKIEIELTEQQTPQLKYESSSSSEPAYVTVINQRKLSCKCGKIYLSQKELSEHQQKDHSNNSSTTFKQELIKEIKEEVDGTKSNQCFCGKIYIRRGDMLKHQSKVHGRQKKWKQNRKQRQVQK